MLQRRTNCSTCSARQLTTTFTLLFAILSVSVSKGKTGLSQNHYSSFIKLDKLRKICTFSHSTHTDKSNKRLEILCSWLPSIYFLFFVEKNRSHKSQCIDKAEKLLNLCLRKKKHLCTKIYSNKTSITGYYYYSV